MKKGQSVECKFQLVVNQPIEWNSGEASIRKQNIGRRFVSITFVFADAVGQHIDAKPLDHLSLRDAKRMTDL